MNTKYILTLVIALGVTLITNAQKKGSKPTPKPTEPSKKYSFTIKGKTLGIKTGQILFVPYPGEGRPDTLAIQDSMFTYTKKINEPTPYYYLLPNRTAQQQPTIVMVDTGFHNMTIDFENNTGYKIDNAASQSMINNFSMSLQPLLEKRNGLIQKLQVTNNDSLSKAYTAIEQQLQATFKNFITTNGSSPVAAFIIYQNIYSAQNMDAKTMQELLNMLSEDGRKTEMGQTAVRHYKRMTADEIGNIAPDFTLADSNGKKYTLSQFRGKYVLVDFWASWCGPCVREFPHLKAANEKYKNKGLVIVGVSIDADREKWLQALRRPDFTNWLHLHDAPGPNQVASDLYYVPTIPRNFLLDKNGKVIEKNLRGEEVDKILSKYLQ